MPIKVYGTCRSIASVLVYQQDALESVIINSMQCVPIGSHQKSLRVPSQVTQNILTLRGQKQKYVIVNRLKSRALLVECFVLYVWSTVTHLSTFNVVQCNVLKNNAQPIDGDRDPSSHVLYIQFVCIVNVCSLKDEEVLCKLSHASLSNALISVFTLLIFWPFRASAKSVLGRVPSRAFNTFPISNFLLILIGKRSRCLTTIHIPIRLD